MPQDLGPLDDARYQVRSLDDARVAGSDSGSSSSCAEKAEQEDELQMAASGELLEPRHCRHS